MHRVFPQFHPLCAMPIAAHTCVPRGLIRRSAARPGAATEVRSAGDAAARSGARAAVFETTSSFKLKPRMESCRAALSRRSPPRPCPAEPLRHRTAPPGLPRAGSSRCCYERQGGVCPRSRAKFCALPALASRRAHLLRASTARVCSPPPWDGAPRSPPLPAVGTPDPPTPSGMGVTGNSSPR